MKVPGNIFNLDSKRPFSVMSDILQYQRNINSLKNIVSVLKLLDYSLYEYEIKLLFIFDNPLFRIFMWTKFEFPWTSVLILD